MSLAELLVATLIVGIVLAAGSTMLLSAVRQQRLSSAKVDTQSDARINLESLTRDLRVAVPNPSGSAATFTEAKATSMTFFSARDATVDMPKRIRYWVDPTSKCLRRSETAATRSGSSVNYSSTGTTSRCLTFSRVDTATPLFTYYSVDAVGATSVIPTSSATTPPGIEAAGSVGIRLELTSPTRPEVIPTVMQQTVTMINQTNTLQGGGAR